MHRMLWYLGGWGFRERNKLMLGGCLACVAGFSIDSRVLAGRVGRIFGWGGVQGEGCEGKVPRGVEGDEG